MKTLKLILTFIEFALLATVIFCFYMAITITFKTL